jgi:competence protein ComEC
MSYLRRYGLVVLVSAYTLTLILLHALGKFPAPGSFDVSRLIRSPSLVFEGRVLSFPQTRWGQTRFVMEGRVHSHEAFYGRVVVTLRFPLEDLAPGETLRVRGWLSELREASGPGVFNERDYWAGSCVFAALRVWSPEAVVRLHGSDHRSWRQLAWVFHQRFKRFWFEHLPEDEAAVVSCMTIGSRGILPTDIKNAFVRAGVYHILVVSGQNMALIIALGMGVLSLLRIPRRRLLWFCAVPIAFYASVVGSDPPVARAAAMAIATLAALSLRRDVPGYIPLVLAWFWILLREPEAIFGASFQLSFGATASLVAAWPWIRGLSRIRSRVLRWVMEAGAVSLVVHLGVWPLLVYYFHQMSLIGFLANWTIFPLSGGLMVAGLVLGSWGVISGGKLPDFLIQGMHSALAGTIGLVRWMSAGTWAAIRCPAPSWTVCVVYYAVLICILCKLRHDQNTSVLQQSRRRL